MFRREDLLSRIEDEPFRPFRIHLTDGDTIDVLEQQTASVGRTTAILPKRYSREADGSLVAETWRTIALVHIVQLSDIEDEQNGKSRRKNHRKP